MHTDNGHSDRKTSRFGRLAAARHQETDNHRWDPGIRQAGRRQADFAGRQVKNVYIKERSS